jgi:hypothetical protein
MPFAIQEGEIGVEMSLQLQMEQMPGYLVARFTGAGVAEEGWRQFESIAEQCKRTKNNKLLIDGTRAEVKPSLVDRFLTARRTLIFAQYGLKVAFVENPERIDPTRFGETVARNRWNIPPALTLLLTLSPRATVWLWFKTILPAFTPLSTFSPRAFVWL